MRTVTEVSRPCVPRPSRPWGCRAGTALRLAGKMPVPRHRTVFVHVLRRCAPLLCALAATVAAGCAGPTGPYDKAQATLIQSRQRLVAGDRDLSAARYDTAAGHYAKAARDLGAAVGDLEAAEQQVDAQIRRADAERLGGEADDAPAPPDDRTVAIGARDVGTDPFYVETLRGYRAALSRAVAMRAVALARTGEAHYRGAAQRVIDGDQRYQAEQFAAARKKYTEAHEEFRAAMRAFGAASDFVRVQILTGDRLAEVAPADTWDLLAPLQKLADHRRAQTDAYLVAVAQRTAQAGEIVAAYSRRDPGNLPDIDVRPLAAMPEVIRYGVLHPPIPSAGPAK